MQIKETAAIMPRQHYEQHTITFTHNNIFTSIDQDPTNGYQKTTKSTINQCTNIIPMIHKHKYYTSNPTPPRIHALIKLNKNPTSIRQKVNWKNTPSYQLATQLSILIKQYVRLPNTYINNTTHLISDLQNINIDQDTRICSFDVTNSYIHKYTNTSHNKHYTGSPRKTRNTSRNHTRDHKVNQPST
jgi:hypothetical protein